MKSRKLKEITTPAIVNFVHDHYQNGLTNEECDRAPPSPTVGNVPSKSEGSDGCRFKIRVIEFDTLSWFKTKMTTVKLSVLIKRKPDNLKRKALSSCLLFLSYSPVT